MYLTRGRQEEKTKKNGEKRRGPEWKGMMERMESKGESKEKRKKTFFKRTKTSQLVDSSSFIGRPIQYNRVRGEERRVQ